MIIGNDNLDFFIGFRWLGFFYELKEFKVIIVINGLFNMRCEMELKLIILIYKLDGIFILDDLIVLLVIKFIS